MSDIESNYDAAPLFNDLLDYDDFAGTEEALAGVKLSSRDSLGRGAFVELMTQIARFQGLQGKFEEAQHSLDEAKDHLELDDSTCRVRYLLEQGRLKRSAGCVEEAVTFFEEAYDCGRSCGEDYHTIDAIHMLAICADGKKSISLGEQAITLAEKSGNQFARNWLGALYNNIGWDCHEQGDFNRALELFNRGLEFRLASGQGMATRVAKWSVARALRSLERHREAIEKLYELEAEWIEANGESGFVFEELAENFNREGNAKAASDYFAKAHKLLKENADVSKERLGRIGRLGKCL